jgi:hypothetical protein
MLKQKTSMEATELEPNTKAVPESSHDHTLIPAINGDELQIDNLHPD